MNKKFKVIFGKEGDDESTIARNMKAATQKCQLNCENKVSFEGRELLVQISSIGANEEMYVITDITQIEQLNLIEMQNQHKKKLLLSFTHEFKTPLHWLNCSLSSITVSEEQIELLKAAKHATNMLSSYTEDMINFNRLGDIKEECKVVKKINIERSINECLAFIDSEVKLKKITTKLSISQDTPKIVMGDPNRYKQILNSILCNSIKACPENKGIITINISLERQRIYSTIADNGPGLSCEEINQILNPLENGSKVELQIRHGLGMLLIKDLCRLIDGDILINSCNDKGSLYTFWFPWIQTPQVQLDEENSPRELLIEATTEKSINFLKARSIIFNENTRPTGQQITPIKLSEVSFQLNPENKKDQHFFNTRLENTNTKLLIVDDTKYNNNVLKSMLRILHLACDECSNGKEAVDTVLGCGENIPYGLIFMDINMPVMDGIEATNLIKQHLKTKNMKDIKIIALSAMDSMDIIERAKSAGIDQYSIVIT